MGSKRSRHGLENAPIVAGNGLIDRRALLGRGVLLAGAMGSAGALTGAAAEPLTNAPWSLEQGAVLPSYQAASRFEKSVGRTLSNPKNEPRTSHARTPHHLLAGTITPNGLHFTICHQGGAPDIDPDKHRLVIHGLVKKPLVFTLDTLARYPMTTRIAFLECRRNTAPLLPTPPVPPNSPP